MTSCYTEKASNLLLHAAMGGGVPKLQSTNTNKAPAVTVEVHAQHSYSESPCLHHAVVRLAQPFVPA